MLPLAVVTFVVLFLLWLRRRRRRMRHAPNSAEMGLSPFCRIPSPAGVAVRNITTSHIRRQVIQEELRAVQEQIVDVGELERRVTKTSDSWDLRSKLEAARERNEQLLARIQELEADLRSAWALGLSDDPPPGYMPRESL